MGAERTCTRLAHTGRAPVTVRPITSMEFLWPSPAPQAAQARGAVLGLARTAAHRIHRTHQTAIATTVDRAVSFPAAPSEPTATTAAHGRKRSRCPRPPRPRQSKPRTCASMAAANRICSTPRMPREPRATLMARARAFAATEHNCEPSVREHGEAHLSAARRRLRRTATPPPAKQRWGRRHLLSSHHTHPQHWTPRIEPHERCLHTEYLPRSSVELWIAHPPNGQQHGFVPGGAV
jgi:hypothetical protein